MSPEEFFALLGPAAHEPRADGGEGQPDENRKKANGETSAIRAQRHHCDSHRAEEESRSCRPRDKEPAGERFKSARTPCPKNINSTQRDGPGKTKQPPDHEDRAEYSPGPTPSN